MELSFSPIQNAFEMSLKGAISHRVTLGTDARGNLIRMDNALASIPDRLTHTKEQLSNVEYQMEAAKAELGKPFPQAEELTQKSSRLAELDAQLNMADSGPVSQEQEKPKTLDEIIAQATAAKAQNPGRNHCPGHSGSSPGKFPAPSESPGKKRNRTIGQKVRVRAGMHLFTNTKGGYTRCGQKSKG